MRSVLIALLAATAVSATHKPSSWRKSHTKSSACTTTSAHLGSPSAHPTSPVNGSLVKGWVKAQNGKFTLDGKHFAFVGANVYWLGLDENTDIGAKVIAYPTRGRVNEALAMVKNMGGTAVRSSPYASLGGELTIEPTRGHFNSEAFDVADYAVYAASRYGLRLIMDLVDNYEYYDGGRLTYLKWRNISYVPSKSGISEISPYFFTDRRVIDDFKNHIKVVLTHRNKYTGRIVGQDPTIAMWQTGNEFGGYILGAGGPPPIEWTREITAHIRRYAPHAIIGDGSDGTYWPTCDGCASGEPVPGVDVSNVQSISSHLYYSKNFTIEKDIEVAKQYRKALTFDEIDWRPVTDPSSGQTPDEFYDMALKHKLSFMPWSLFGRNVTESANGTEHCGRYVIHNETYSFYPPSTGYPRGNVSSAEYEQLSKIVEINYKITGRTPPKTWPVTECPQPKLL